MTALGRPSLYTPEIAAEVCERMAKGETLNQICRDEHMPAASTIRLWAIDDREGFSAQYASARESLYEHWGEEILDIADDGSNDWTTRKSGDDEIEVVDHEHIQRSKLRVDTRKWLLSKLLPKKYGERLELSGNKDAPVTVEIVRFTEPPK